MAGNAANTALWDGADIFVDFSKTAAGPTDLTTAWAAEWLPAGLLDGEDGITHGREQESGEHYAWGGTLYKRTKSKHKRTTSFVGLEDNAVTFRLVNPGSTRSATGGVRRSEIKIPTSESFSIGQELRERGSGKIKRRWCRVAEVQEVADITENETDPVVYEITVVLFPESDDTIWHELETDPDYVAPVV